MHNGPSKKTPDAEHHGGYLDSFYYIRAYAVHHSRGPKDVRHNRDDKCPDPRTEPVNTPLPCANLNVFIHSSPNTEGRIGPPYLSTLVVPGT